MNKYSFVFKDSAAQVSGEVKGVDLRDAASRFFTSSLGMALAKENGIPPDVLRVFPGNADSEIKHDGGNWSLHLVQMPATTPQAMGLPIWS